MAKRRGAPKDTRVYDVRVRLDGEPHAPWRLISFSGDATLPEFYRTVQGAFEWREWLLHPRLEIGGAVYEGSKGARTALRRVFAAQARAVLTLSGDETHVLNLECERSYEVPSRRHHPKVLDGEGAGASGRAFDLRFATWDAQEMARAIVEPAPSPERDVKALIRKRALPGVAAGNIETLRGFFVCIVTGPMIMPSEWMPMVLGDPRKREWASIEAMRATTEPIMNFYNAVAKAINDDAIERRDVDARWCEGYMFGVILRGNEWKAPALDSAFRQAFDPIAAGSQGGKVDADAVVRGIPIIRAWWRDRLMRDVR